METNDDRKNQAAQTAGTVSNGAMSPRFALAAHSAFPNSQVVGLNEIMRSLVSHREWLVPLEMFAREGESKRRIEKMLILGSERVTPADELWIFTDEEAALTAQTKYPSLGTFGGGMSGTELFGKVPPNVKIVSVNPGSPEKFSWHIWAGGTIRALRMWARMVALEDQFAEWEQTGAFDETAFAGFPFITFRLIAGGVMMLPYESLTVNRAAVFTAPDCVEKFLSQFSERQRAQLQQVPVEGATMLRQLPELGADGIVVNVAGPGATFVHDFVKKPATNQFVQTPAESKRETLDSAPPEAIEFLKFGIENMQSGNYQVALLDLTSAIKLLPDYVKAYRLRGICFNTLGHYREAVGDFSKVLESNPNDADILFQRGWAFIRTGDPKSAVADFDKSIEINGENADAFFQRGVAWWDLKNYNEALRDYGKVIELTPADDQAYTNRGMCFLNLDDFDAAIRDFNQSLALNPSGFFALQQRGTAYNRKGDHELALNDLSRAIESGHRNADTFFQRGIACIGLEGRENYDKAIRDFDKVIELAPDFYAGYSNRALCYHRNGDYDRAIQDYGKAIELQNDNSSDYLMRAIAFAKKGEFDKAVEDFSRAIELNPKCFDAYLIRGAIYADEMKDYARAIEDFSKAIELNSNSIQAIQNRAMAYERQGSAAEAEADRRKVLEIRNFLRHPQLHGLVDYADLKIG